MAMWSASATIWRGLRPGHRHTVTARVRRSLASAPAFVPRVQTRARGPSFLAAVPQRSRTTHGRPATAVVTRASVSFSDDIRGYGVGHVDTAAPKVAKVSVPHLVALLLDLTADGEGIIRGVLNSGNLGLRDKGGRDDVTGAYVKDAQTEADRRIETHVLRALREFCPTLPVVGEESHEGQLELGDGAGEMSSRPTGGGGGGFFAPRTAAAAAALDLAQTPWPSHVREPIDASRVCVYVDPLDGTNEFAAGNLVAVTCLLGVAVDGRPAAGVIGQPFHTPTAGRIVWGGRGVGVRGLEEIGDARRVWNAGLGGGGESPGGSPSDAALRFGGFTVCVNRVTRDDRIDAVLDATNATIGEKVSATGYHFLRVLEGAAHCGVLLRAGTKKWDTCGGEALLREAGGVVSDAAGRRYDYSHLPAGAMNPSGLVIAHDAGFHRWLTKSVREVLEQTLRDSYPLDVFDPSVRPPSLPPAPHGGWRALTVDVGGCLLSPVEPVTETYLRLAAVHGVRGITRDSVKAAIRAGFAAPPPPEQRGVRYVGDGRGFWRPLVAAAMGGLADDDPTLDAVLDDLYAHYENPAAWCVAPGAKEAFKRLRAGGVKVAVISNWDTRLPKLLRDCGFDESLIDTVVVSAEQMSDKPDARIFEAALERLGEVGNEAACVHVGDSSVNDVEGSARAGFGASLLWTPSLGVGNAFDFGEIADEMLASRE